MKSSIVVASTLNDCIGLNNTLPWSLTADLKRFKSITSSQEHSVVIMDRKTYESIGRMNYVLTRDLKAAKNISYHLSIIRS